MFTSERYNASQSKKGPAAFAKPDLKHDSNANIIVEKRTSITVSTKSLVIREMSLQTWYSTDDGLELL